MTLTRLICAPTLPARDRLALWLYLCDVVCCDHGDAFWREGFQTYTCSTGIITGGVN